ncbi:MAG: hypothetical protein R3A12_18735 [Ignavibacteria bacterium]
MCGQNGNIYKTLKTVSPYTPYNTGTSNTLNSITFLNSNTGYVCGDGGFYLRPLTEVLTGLQQFRNSFG